MKVLQIIDQAFRATGEEQDDTIVWLCRCMRAVGAEFQLLLSGNAAFYALERPPAPKLQFGDWTQSHPADVSADIRALLDSGIPVSVVAEDLEERGISAQPGLQGIRRILRRDLVALYDSVDQVWQW